MQGLWIKRVLPVALVVLVLPGCVQKRIREASAACTEQHSSSHVEQADCMTAVETRFPMNNLPPDLMDLFQAQRKLISSNIDRGTVTPTEAAVQIAIIKTQLVGTSIQRQPMVIPVSSGPSPTQQLLDLADKLNPPRPLQINTNCVRNGPFTNCNTY